MPADVPCIYCTTDTCEHYRLAMDASGIPGIPTNTVWCGWCMLQSLVDAPAGTEPDTLVPAG